ncbi:hypothetical protein [Sinomicrobium sp. M5D2P9]
MNQLLSIAFFICFNVALFNLQAQTVVIDSLQTLIDNPNTTNGNRIEAMEQLAKIKIVKNLHNEALQLITGAQKLSRQEKDTRYTALVKARLSSLYNHQDSLNLAFQEADSAQWYANKTQDKTVKGRVLMRKAALERKIENTDKAYKTMLEALRMFEEEENTEHYKSNIYHFLAAIYAHWEEPKKQLHYTKRCLDAAQKSKDPDAIANAYLSMGSSYLHRYRKDTAQKALLDSSKYAFKKIITYTEAHKKRITLPSTAGIAALNLANLYFEFYPVSYKDSAEIYLHRAIAYGKTTNNPEIIANSYGILSEYALKDHDYKQAENLLLLALGEIADDSGGTLSKLRITNALSRVAEKSGNPAKALDYYKQYVQYDKALFDEKTHFAIQKLEVQYQSEKKELALAAAKNEAAFSKKLNTVYAFMLIAGIVALFFLYRSYHFKLRASKREQLLLAGEKKEAELKADLKTEETARLQAERKLMQERLDRVEKELLAGTLQVEEKNTLLKELKEGLEQLDNNDTLYRQFKRLLAKNTKVDKGYSDIKKEFAQIHPEFIERLQKKAENKLTRLDLKYCSYILMGLTNKEMATKLNIAPKSIRMAHYRIKQKLKLPKEQSLDKFINDLGANTS